MVRPAVLMGRPKGPQRALQAHFIFLLLIIIICFGWFPER